MESRGSADGYRRELAAGMREKAGVLEDAVFNRLRALAESAGKGGHRDEVQAVIHACLEYGFASIELGLKGYASLPPEAGTHARAVASRGTSTSILQDRYIAGHTLFKKFLWDQRGSARARSDGGFGEALTASSVAFEKLVSFVRIEHEEELAERNASPGARLLKRIQQLLSGELIHPPSDIPYNFHGTHIGVVGTGPDVGDEIGRLAKALGAGQKLVVPVSPNEVWAWIGLQRQPSASQLDHVVKKEWDPTMRMAVGEPAPGLSGWRITHRQAQSAFSLAKRGPCSIVLYADVCVLASIDDDDLVKECLQNRFIAPLERESAGGAALLTTIDIYFKRDRSISSTAAHLKIDRRTVRSRLDKIEALLGKTISSVAFELEAALLLRRYGPA